MTSRWIAMPAVVALLALAASAAEPACPATLETKQDAVKAPAGWTPFLQKAPGRLETVTFFDGPPEEEASLVFDNEVKGKGTWTGIWKFSGGARPIYLMCQYQGTRVTLTRKLAAETKECRVTFQNQGNILQSMACR